MADIIDSLEKDEIAFDAAIQAARKPVVTLNPSKKCWCCGEPTDEHRRWVDAEHRDIWLAENPQYR